MFQAAARGVDGDCKSCCWALGSISVLRRNANEYLLFTAEPRLSHAVVGGASRFGCQAGQGFLSLVCSDLGFAVYSRL